LSELIGLPAHQYSKLEILEELDTIWEDEYTDSEFPWSKSMDSLYQAIEQHHDHYISDESPEFSELSTPENYQKTHEKKQYR